MADPSLDRILAEREKLYDRVRSIKETAAAVNRSISEDELKIIEECNAEIPKLDRQLDILAQQFESTAKVRERIVQVSVAVDQAPAVYRSPGQAVWDALHPEDDNAHFRYQSALNRAASHMGTLAADTTPVAGDLHGIMVTAKGPLLVPYPGTMPLASALGLGDITAGTMELPYLVDDNFETGVDVQSLQKKELASQPFFAEMDTVKPKTLGGYLNVSLQLLRWSAGALGIIVGQMNRRRSAKIDTALFTELSGSTGKVTLAADADAAAIQKAIFQAAAMVGEATDEAPTILLMGWLGFARLGALTDLAQRAILPLLGPANAQGTASAAGEINQPYGLRPVVTKAITDDTFWVLNGACVSGYIYNYGALEAVEPSVLGRQVAVASDLVTKRPTPYANAAVHLAP